VTRGWLPQTAGSPSLNGGGSAASDVNKDLGLKAKAKAKDSRYQGQSFHRSSPYSVHYFSIPNVMWVFLCPCTSSCVNYILSVYE